MTVAESDDEPHEFWLASYPRSGNTLARITLSQALLPADQQDLLETNFPSIDIEQTLEDQAVGKSISNSVKTGTSLVSGARFKSEHGSIRFVKTHWCSPEVMDLRHSVGAAFFVRHPVDVFLSGLNYMYVNAERDLAFKNYFINYMPRPILEIAECGELDFYVADFVKNEGFWPFEFGSGKWSTSVRSWLAAAKERNIRVFTYSRLVTSRAEVLEEISLAAGLTLTKEQVDQGVRGGEEATKPDGKFYWRGGDGIKSNYLRPEHIAMIEDALLKPTGIELTSM